MSLELVEAGASAEMEVVREDESWSALLLIPRRCRSGNIGRN